MVHWHYKSTKLNNLNAIMVFLCLENFWASHYAIILLEELATTSRDNLVNTIASFELSYHVESLQFCIMMPAQWCHHFSLSGYLSPPTRLSPHYRVTLLARVQHACIIHENANFDWNLILRTSKDLKRLH